MMKKALALVMMLSLLTGPVRAAAPTGTDYLSDLSNAAAVAATNTFALCQQASACTSAQSLVTATITQLMTYINAHVTAVSTVTANGNTETGVTTAAFGTGFSVPGGSSGTAAISLTNVINAPADGGSHSYTALSSDLVKEIELASTFTGLAVPQATGSFASGAAFDVCNHGAITATSTTSKINNIAGATGIKLGAFQCSHWASDGTDWDAFLGVPQPSTQTGTTFLRDDMTWAAAGGTGFTIGGTITSGGGAGVIYDNGGVIGETTTPTVVGLTVTGNQSAAAWTTSGIKYKGSGSTLTDTTSSGTVAAAYTNLFGGNTIAASAATTFTAYYGTYFQAPANGTNVTFTNKFAVGADSIAIAAGTVSLPSLAFQGDPTTGLYSTGANTFGLAVGGAQHFDYGMSTGNQFTFRGAINCISCEYKTTVANGGFVAASNGWFYFNGRTALTSGADGKLVLSPFAGPGNAFTALQFGGTTNAFPELKISSTTIIARLADDTADAPFTASNVTASGSLTNTGITTDATHTDATVCEDTTSHQFYFGSGAAGICLGTSSLRFKRDVRALGSDLALDVLKLEPIQYRYKPDGGHDSTRLLYGFAAEQVAEVMPQLVGYDTEGRPNSVDWAGIVPLNTLAIKELNARMDRAGIPK